MDFDQRLKELCSLEKDDGFDPPDEVAASLAGRVFAEYVLAGLKASRVVPHADGGLVISFKNDEKIATITCYNDGEMKALMGNGCRLLKVLPINDNAALRDAVEAIRGFLKG